MFLINRYSFLLGGNNTVGANASKLADKSLTDATAEDNVLLRTGELFEYGRASHLIVVASLSLEGI